MASSASSSWLSQTERRLQDLRNKDIEGSGIARWKEASKILSKYDNMEPGPERSQLVLNEIRKDIASKKLQFDPHRFTFLVEGRPIQVHVSYRLLQGSGGTLVGSRSPSPALLGFLCRRSAISDLNTSIGHFFQTFGFSWTSFFPKTSDVQPRNCWTYCFAQPLEHFKNLSANASQYHALRTWASHT